jgi:hypothetical protein
MNYCRNIVKLNSILTFNSGAVTAQLPLDNQIGSGYPDPWIVCVLTRTLRERFSKKATSLLTTTERNKI